MTQADKKQAKKQEIIKVAEQFRDERGNIDLAKMRTEQGKVYSKISYYFGNIDNFMAEANNGESIQFNASSAIRNQLAFKRISYLRDEKKLSYEELGQMYDKTRMYMSKLYRSLEIEKNDADVGTTLSRPVVRNQLAFEALYELIANGRTFKEIEKEYNVSAEYAERLYTDWEKLFSSEGISEMSATLAI